MIHRLSSNVVKARAFRWTKFVTKIQIASAGKMRATSTVVLMSVQRITADVHKFVSIYLLVIDVIVTKGIGSSIIVRAMVREKVQQLRILDFTYIVKSNIESDSALIL